MSAYIWLNDQLNKEGLERRILGGFVPEGTGTLAEYGNLMRTKKPVVYYQDIGQHSYATV